MCEHVDKRVVCSVSMFCVKFMCTYMCACACMHMCSFMSASIYLFCKLSLGVCVEADLVTSGNACTRTRVCMYVHTCFTVSENLITVACHVRLFS